MILIKNIYNTLLFIISLSILFFSCEENIVENTPDNLPPQVTILFPFNGGIVSGETIIQARSIDNQETHFVEFYINQQKVFTDSTSNDNDIFTFRWDTEEKINLTDTLINLYIEDQYYYINVIAYDISGNSYATPTIRNKIDNIDNENPNAFILFPFQGQTVDGNVDITVIASDNDSIANVNFYIDNRLEAIRPATTLISELDQFGNETNFDAYVYTWNTELADDGYHSIRITVFDLNENSSIITPTGVNVNNGAIIDPIPPTGSIISPPAGLTVNGTVPIIVNANDNVALEGVAFSIDGEYMETIFTPPYAFMWNTLTAAEDSDHIISAIVIDYVGNETPLNPISVFVDNLIDPDIIPPSASIFYPAAGQIVSGEVNIIANTTDNNGVAYVIFFIDGNEVYIDDLEPYNYTWNTELNTEDNEHTIAIASCDIFTNCTLGQPITVFVDNYDNILPNGEILNPHPGQIIQGSIDIQISANDNIGIKNVVPYINGVPVDTISDFPYSHIWETTLYAEDSYHVVSGIISDSSDNLFYLSPVVVFIDNYINDISPPSGVISNPVSGQTVQGTVQFSVFAQDNYGINNVDFFINGTNVGSDSEFPYQYQWETSLEVNNSEYALSATIIDNADNSVILQPILVTVVNE